MAKLFHFLKKMNRNQVLVILLIFTFISSLWQNCSQVKLEPIELSSTLKIQGAEESFLKLPENPREEFRAGIVVDMSNSMFSGACPDSIDVSIDNVNPSINCLGPTGIDPEGKRFKLILRWITELEEKVAKGKLKSDKVKLVILPFSNSLINQYWSLENSYYGNTRTVKITVINKILTLLGWDKEIIPGFISLTAAKKQVYLLWSMFSYLHGAPIDRDVPSDITNAVKKGWPLGANASSSSGTSIVLPALEKLNLEIFSELTKLKEKKAVDKSHFEFVFLSDGVPKPHALHIEKAMKFVWAAKKEVCDPSIYPNNANCATSISSTSGWQAANAINCFSRCETYIKNYVDTGSVSLPALEKPVCTGYYSAPYACRTYSDGSTSSNRWSKDNMKCGQCFEMLNQFSYTRGTCVNDSCRYSSNQDSFKIAIQNSWGDWTQNRHSEIIGRLKTVQNIFKIQFPSSIFKFNFIRIDSENPSFATQAGELIPELNWIEKSKEYFINKHRYFVMKKSIDIPELFSELQENNKYNLNQVYLYLRNARSQLNGNYLSDSDGDGVADIYESPKELLNSRSNTYCLDIIRNKYSSCLTSGCEPKIDFDKDGLNQCEEKTLGTDDFNPDSDGDSILDGAEILYGLNPTQNDQKISLNTDGFTNFEHFIKGFSPVVNLSLIKEQNIIKISTEFINTKEVVDEKGIKAIVPSYIINVDNVPYIDLNGKITNQIVVVLKVDNLANPEDILWLSKTYEITKENRNLNIKLSDFNKLDLESP